MLNRLRFALLRLGSRLPFIGDWCARRTQMAWYYLGGFVSWVDYSSAPESAKFVVIRDA